MYFPLLLGELMEAIKRDFGSFQKLKEKMSSATVAVQGSGWGWLGFDKENGRLRIAACANQDPLQGSTGKICQKIIKCNEIWKIDHGHFSILTFPSHCSTMCTLSPFVCGFNWEQLLLWNNLWIPFHQTTWSFVHVRQWCKIFWPAIIRQLL